MEDEEIRDLRDRGGLDPDRPQRRRRLRLDDPSVSRRHALIVSEAPKALRVLDDRSLNGVFVNGELVEWARLGDGDELTIGRYRLFVLEA